MVGSPQVPLEMRRGSMALSAAMQAGVEEVVGFVPVIGTGEVLLEAHFPVNFVGQPAIYGGGSLRDPGPHVEPPVLGESPTLADELGLVDGSFPTWNVGVARWRTAIDDATTLYVGAVFAIVVTGNPGQFSTVNWTVRGSALRNPL